MAIRASWLLVGAAALCAAVVGFMLARQLDSSAPALASGTWLSQPRAVGTFSLVDQSGRRFTQADLAGHPSLVFFGFTHCPDVCPTTLAKLAQLRRQPGTPPLRVLFVSVDPARDTPPVLEHYLHAFDGSFVGLTGDEASVTLLLRRFGIAAARIELPGGDYTVDHTAALFLLDTRGAIVGVFTPPFDVGALAKDLRNAAPYLGGKGV